MEKELIVLPAEQISGNPIWQRLIYLAKQRDIKVEAVDFGFRAVQGIYYTINDYQTIAIDSCLPEEKRQFVLAHELGHAILHKGTRINFNAPEELKEKGEKEANHFARHLLWWVERRVSHA